MPEVARYVYGVVGANVVVGAGETDGDAVPHTLASKLPHAASPHRHSAWQFM